MISGDVHVGEVSGMLSFSRLIAVADLNGDNRIYTSVVSTLSTLNKRLKEYDVDALHSRKQEVDDKTNSYESLLALMKIKNKDIATALELPSIKIHCSVLAEDSIKKAIEDYEAKQ